MYGPSHLCFLVLHCRHARIVLLMRVGASICGGKTGGGEGRDAGGRTREGIVCRTDYKSRSSLWSIIRKSVRSPFSQFHFRLVSCSPPVFFNIQRKFFPPSPLAHGRLWFQLNLRYVERMKGEMEKKPEYPISLAWPRASVAS